jgi:hypothetical protein
VNLQLTPMTATFSAVMNTVHYTLTNWGVTPSGTINAPVVAATQNAPGDLSYAFSVANDTCSASLVSAASCGFDVLFKAPVFTVDDAGVESGMPGGPFTGTVSVTDSSSNSASGTFSGSY